ncbi:hypothetical protein [Amycolatopsis samaneae]|uniref:Uncharacterized protein n=1 Tax=Amycolatopsis samaneae TaxID=664691 RepID=A0ABW5G8Q9_9PSEU
MDGISWVHSPIGARDRHLSTRVGCKSVLVLVPFMVAGTRLLDLLPLIEADHRVQVVFSVPETWESWQATHDFVRAQGGVVLPWAHARRGGYDLVLAGSTRGIDEVAGPVVLVPHGGGLAQYRPWRPPGAGDEHQPVLGLDADQLLREGRVRAEAIVLTHDDELAVLKQVCPRAVPAAVVAGNIAFDRLCASVPFREHYRRALGVTDEKLVVVTSTWSERSAFGSHHDLFERVLAELPPERYRVVGALHPQIWSHHGEWQVRAWLADCLRAGLRLLPPDEGWRAALVAADHVIGDYGSVTTYAAGLGTPVLLTDCGGAPLLPGSPSDVVARRTPRWRPGTPLATLLADRPDHDPGAVRRLLTSRPGQSGAILRRTMYRLLGLDEPARAVPASPVPLPRLLPS